MKTIPLITVFQALMVVAGLVIASFITSFPSGSLQAILLAVAAAGCFFNFGFLVYVQDKENNNKNKESDTNE